MLAKIRISSRLARHDAVSSTIVRNRSPVRVIPDPESPQTVSAQ
jgi:hypothetical protein